MGAYLDPPAVLTAESDFPELCVEWLPSEGPNSPSGDWCDITSYVAEGSTTRGRNYEQDRFESGTITLTLKSVSRLFDPENTAGPFYGKLLPMRQVRVSAVWAGVRYPVFRGYIQSWGNTTPDDVMFVTTITAKDAFAWFEQKKLPSSAWALEVIKDDPSAWFRLGESDTVRMTDNSPNGNYGIYDNCQQGQGGLVVNDSDQAVSFAHSLEERAVIQNPNLITGFPFTVSMLFQIDNSEPGGNKTMFSGLVAPPSTSTSFVLIAMGSNSGVITPSPGMIYFYIRDASSGAYVWTSHRYDDGAPHHLAAIAPSGTFSGWKVYVDGIDVTTTGGGTNPSWPGQPANGWVVGNYIDLVYGDYGFGANADGLGVSSQDVRRGTIDELLVWNGTSVPAERISAGYSAAFGWDGDDTGTRVSRFLDAIDWPTALRDIDTGISILGPASWSSGSSALSALQGWADTEAGAFFIGRSGEIVWRSRHYPLLEASARTSQVTFADNGVGLSIDMNQLEPVRDETLIRNPVQASRKNGVSVTVEDASFKDVFGDRTWASPTTEDQKDASVRDRAMWFLARFKDLRTRVRSMRVSPRSDPANLWPQVLGRELGDRFTLQRTPLGLNGESEYEQILERVSHKFSPKTWQTTWVGSPVDPNVGDYLILDDAVEGLLDTGLLAY